MNATFGPYSLLRKAGDLYFTAGHIGVNSETKLVASEAGAQTTAALDNLATTLATIGLTLDDIIKTTIFVTDMADFAEVNKVYVARFTEPRPARSTVAVVELPRVATNGPVKVEIEAVAMKPKESS